MIHGHAYHDVKTVLKALLFGGEAHGADHLVVFPGAAARVDCAHVVLTVVEVVEP